ncbi:MAG: ParB N-terminal domain-containing protein, partial [Rhizobiales bacterium]|nr:ParB N-terminal domain-containing protein [Hyphomicrobiales bacterium]
MAAAQQQKLPWDIEMIPLDKLRPAERNARTHSRKQVQQIADSIKRFGAITPLVTDDRGTIVAGHGRFAAAKLLGIKHFPTIRLANIDEASLRAFRIADNKIAQNAGWDREILAFEFRDLQIELPEIDLTLDITGFEADEVDSLMSDLVDTEAQPTDAIPEMTGAPVARTGDLFLLGRHRLLVGDARDQKCFKALMQTELATMAFLDPPYNVKINGHAGGRGRTKHREFACASGEMSPGEFKSFLTDTLVRCARFTIDGAIHFVCMDWRHCEEIIQAGATAYKSLKNICVWNKTSPGQGSFYRSQHEFVFVFKNGDAPHINTFELGQRGRSRSNVWTYPGVNTFKTGRFDDLRMHPTVKPVALISDALKDCSERGSIVLDAFSGSVSTTIAAEQIGRRA